MPHKPYEPPTDFGWVPIGGWNYGYKEDYQNISSWTIWAMVTWGSFSESIPEAAAILGIAMMAQENVDGSLYETLGGMTADSTTSGASWVHNIQGGYCWWHYFFRGKRTWPLALGSWTEAAGDLGAIAQELMEGERLYSHEAHANGAGVGMMAAALLEMARPRKGKKTSMWRKAFPFAMIAILIMREKQKRTELKDRDEKDRGEFRKERLETAAGLN
jgi:hypothetical protein